ncbi:Gfo/Idh/MocA family oxidoreductase [Aurantibacter crassamenti]|uniref:Gfo/Idh/MocA family protein n=1 Tax=Aurantibacter crassamenti TaxID=1837375 RepID=UPI00193A56EB|nr:Gfo/Idh/MocA family oxidoreductase [Aurantibacter crassamenti]MBM1107777.1 Gfo/Idh/MocA family oxidoreductase [Aurantibacter crassamenti]
MEKTRIINYNRRNFIQNVTIASAGLSIIPSSIYANISSSKKIIKVGMIGLDTSHSIEYTKLLNDPNAPEEIAGFPVVAAYPLGSSTIESSFSRIPKYTKEMEEMGVKIVDSLSELLNQVDVILLESNDGGVRLEQTLEVLKKGKPMFVDKPVAATFADVSKIYKAAEKYKVPMFSSSSLRFLKNADAIRNKNSIGKVMGATTYSPCYIEPSHTDLFWYGVHGVELLFTVMGTGCKSIRRDYTEDSDIVYGTWQDGRVGVYRGRPHWEIGFGGIAFGEKGNLTMGPHNGYTTIVKEIVSFFKTHEAPVLPQETLEIYAFMEAADESKRNNGATILLDQYFHV